MHNGTIRADGSPDELLQETGQESLEEAYVSLTSDKARARSEDDKRKASWQNGGDGSLPEHARLEGGERG